MLTKEESQLKNAMKILIRDGKSSQHYEAAKNRYVSMTSQERLVNIALDINPDGADFELKGLLEDCNTIDNLIK